MKISPKKEAIGHTSHHNFFMNCNLKIDISSTKEKFQNTWTTTNYSQNSQILGYRFYNEFPCTNWQHCIQESKHKKQNFQACDNIEAMR
jgi:hypothetical protein